MTKKNNGSSISDIDAFRDAMHDVKKLKPTDYLIHKNKSLNPKLIHQEIVENATLTDNISDDIEMIEMNPDTTLSFCRTGVRNTEFKKLRTGKLTIADELDLHGLRITHAKEALLSFLTVSSVEQNECVLIIHGKGLHNPNGKSILKTYLNSWLQQQQRVLAFHSATPQDGGRGAVYVLLKRI